MSPTLRSHSLRGHPQAAVRMLVASVIAITVVRGRKEDLLPQGSTSSETPVLAH